MLREKRTNKDFTNHAHRIEIFKNESGGEIRVDHFQVNSNRMNYIRFTNTDELMIVDGDYGNWIFCRPFVPSKNGYVSTPYWLEKLRYSSSQEAGSYDSDETEKEIRELIESGLEEHGYVDDELSDAKEWFEELLEHTECDVEYQYHAYYCYSAPSFIDTEMIPYCKKMNIQLEVIFDAFDEICNRLEKMEEDGK